MVEVVWKDNKHPGVWRTLSLKIAKHCHKRSGAERSRADGGSRGLSVTASFYLCLAFANRCWSQQRNKKLLKLEHGVNHPTLLQSSTKETQKGSQGEQQSHRTGRDVRYSWRMSTSQRSTIAHREMCVWFFHLSHRGKLQRKRVFVCVCISAQPCRKREIIQHTDLSNVGWLNGICCNSAVTWGDLPSQQPSRVVLSPPAPQAGHCGATATSPQQALPVAWTTSPRLHKTIWIPGQRCSAGRWPSPCPDPRSQQSESCCLPYPEGFLQFKGLLCFNLGQVPIWFELEGASGGFCVKNTVCW